TNCSGGGIITGNSIKHGILTSNSNVNLNSNIIVYNDNYPLQINPDNVNEIFTNNTVSGLSAESSIKINGGILSKDAVYPNTVTYEILGTITVKGTDGQDGITTLTINEGTVFRFAASSQLIIGASSGEGGALIARGTQDNPIIFTSNKPTPSKGDWAGIFFYNTTDDTSSIIDHCIIEYCHSYGIYTNNASPSIRNSIIRNTNGYGIAIVTASPSILCSTIVDNGYGIYVSGNSYPIIENNNLMRNTQYGISSYSSIIVTAKNNWWGDVNGPNNTGDKIYGNVDYTPWLTEESPCSPPLVNVAPFIPSNPSPANGAIRINSEVILSWTGGDPNFMDQVVYDVYFGTASSNLQKTAESLSESTYSVSGLNEGSTYYWKIIAKDKAGLEASSPVWSFTTNGSSPDLIVSDITWYPSENILPGQSITFKASIKNNGLGPVVDQFYVEFYIDESSIGKVPVNQIIHAEETIEINRQWTSVLGQHIIKVTADCNQSVSETNEDNNVHTKTLPIIANNTPPKIINVIPQNNSFINLPPSNITIGYQSVNDINTANSVYTIKNSGMSEIDGSWQLIQSEKKLVFTPNSQLAESAYTITIQLEDMLGNSSNEAVFTFTTDYTAPQSPQISNIITPTYNKNQVIQGSKEAYASVILNDQQIIGNISGTTWQYNASLSNGENILRFKSKDRAGNLSEEIAKTIVLIDVPPEIIDLNVECSDTSLLFTWNYPDHINDLAGFKVYFNNSTNPQVLTPEQKTFEVTNLSPATSYPCKITAFDNDDNESSGMLIDGITLLPNPSNVSVTARNKYVEISWNPVPQSQYIKHYAVYVSESDFSSVESLTPIVTDKRTTAVVSSLKNNITYYFAVTTANASGCEKKSVTTVSGSPQADTQGPDITNIKINNNPLENGITITNYSNISLNASDASGVSRVEFHLDGEIIRTDYNGNPIYFCNIDISSMTDGAHTLTITAYDTLSNSAEQEFSINVALSTPQAPTITEPSGNITTYKKYFTIKGNSEKNTEIFLYNNGTEIEPNIPVNSSGKFECNINLNDGTNNIQAASKNRAGLSSFSSGVVITIDSTMPAPPSGLIISSKPLGEIRLEWNKSSDSKIIGYNIYRSNASFSAIPNAVKINSNPIINTDYKDVPNTDGRYFYRITSVNNLGNESELSAEVSALSDSIIPKAVNITYSPTGNYDALTGAMASGRVNVSVTVSELLQATPFLTIAPENGLPISVELRQSGNMEYVGYFDIKDTTPSGTAYAVFSARDLSGNRGTEVQTGESIIIDAEGPKISRLVIQPINPVKNNEQTPVTITVIAGLTEKVKDGTTPNLSYVLSSSAQSAININSINKLAAQSTDAETWQCIFILPSQAGKSAPEALSFVYQGIDSLENSGTKIICQNNFQVYQGNLPPLSVPNNLIAKALSEGKIKLTWDKVDRAFGYQIYRKAPNESEITEYTRVESLLEYTDNTTSDGIYVYGIASIRQDNGQESISSMSAAVSVTSDSVCPISPTNLQLSLTPQGIKAEWEYSNSENVNYRLYRSNALEILSIDGLTPIKTEIAETIAIDALPSISEHCYVVTAVDEADNESEPSNFVYLNFSLLPVSSIKIEQIENNNPTISWTHESGTIAGYDLYIGKENNKINSTLITNFEYVDSGFSGDERIYFIVAVDNNQAESLPRSITLPALKVDISENSTIKRGIMNRLEYAVQNNSSAAVQNIQIIAKINNIEHVSEKFNLQASESKTIPIIVGGYADLKDIEILDTIIKIIPHDGELIEIKKTSEILVYDGMLVLQILNEEFVKGGLGKVQFTLENTGKEEIEIITSKNNKQSDEIRIELLDKDENIIAYSYFMQNTGGVITLANGNTVARIAAGKIFQSEFADILVPSNAQDSLKIRLSISNIYFHHGKTDEVKMQGLTANSEISLIETPYYGEITDIDPKNSIGDKEIIISGRAIRRDINEPMPLVPLKVVIESDGFSREFEVYTKEDGNFTFPFIPLSGETGKFTVRAVHPDISDKKIQSEFVINRVNINPSEINLNVPKNYEQKISVKINTGKGTELNNLKLTYSNLPEGVNIALKDPITYIGEDKTETVEFTVWADNNVEEACKFVLNVESDESQSWGKIVVNAHFSESLPILYYTPSYIQTGVAQNDSTIETITIENKGFDELVNVNASIINQDGSEAPSWVYLNCPSDLGNISIGSKKEIPISFSPQNTVSEGIYSFYLQLTASNHKTVKIGLYASVSQSGKGEVLFKIIDIYTGFVDPNTNERIQGVNGAKIRIQNEKVLTEIHEKITDNIGETLFEDIPAGTYKCTVNANEHQEYIGRFWIKPGITVNQEVFIEYNLVTVEWEVIETSIEDKYEIVLNATYKTNVPAAVIVAEPPSISLPKMKAGDVFNAEFTLTNYGLIRADNVNFQLPENDRYFKYELISGIPDTLEAKQRITVPYRVICLNSLEQEDGSGGGCTSHVGGIQVSAEFKCIHGFIWPVYTRHILTYYSGNCSNVYPPPLHIPGSTVIGLSSGDMGLSGGSSTYSPPSTSVSGSPCAPNPLGFIMNFMVEHLFKPLKEIYDNVSHVVGCSVNTLSREFNENVIDLTVKVPGGSIIIERWYFDDYWYWKYDPLIFHDLSDESERARIINNGKPLNTIIPSGIVRTIRDSSNLKELIDIRRGGIIYSPVGRQTDTSAKENIFINGACKITKSDDGWRWEDSFGNWEQYNSYGVITSIGNRNGIIGKFILDGVRVIGVTDKNDRQVLWIEEELLSKVIRTGNEESSPQIEYKFTDQFPCGGKGCGPNGTEYVLLDFCNSKLLESVKDLLGRTTFYKYSKDIPVKALKREKPNSVPALGVGVSNGSTSSQIVKPICVSWPRNTMISTTDSAGRVTEISHNDLGAVSEVSSPSRVHKFEYEYDDSKKEFYTKITTPSGMIKEVWYNGNNGHTKRVDINGRTVQKIDESTQSLSITDEKGKVTTKTYDQWENLTSIAFPDGAKISFIYDNVFHKPVQMIDSLGNINKYEYDDKGNLIKKIEAYGTDAERTSVYTYDEFGQILSASILGDANTETATTTFEWA
ncbi:MAG: fibronectin type III domain-containing protein, partial [Desulfobacterales bacterium]|nr:fibronectin type III domain-containing protein [Desulfobacterales bacterium]